MAGGSRRARALAVNVSVVALSVGLGAKAASAQSTVTLDPITVVATKTEEKAIDALAGVSTVRKDQIDQLMASRTSDILYGIPSVWFQQRGDSPATSISIRGLQDFGRVAVVVDGARQNFTATGHGTGSGSFFLEPELLAGADIVRGPVANIYGSGAIGGVASFRTLDTDDILRPGERWGTQMRGTVGTNTSRTLGSFFGGARPSANVDVFGGATWRKQGNYVDGSGATIPQTGNEIETGIAKATFRPADGHEVKFGGIVYNADYDTGQNAKFNESIYGTNVRDTTATARWRYAKPEDRLFNFDGNVYWHQTVQDQVKLATGSDTFISGPVGAGSRIDLATTGFDVHNTTRVDTGPLRHAFTYGGDLFHDDGKTSDTGTKESLFTPSGERTVWGSFAQWKMNYSTWLETIGALRYDRYDLSGTSTSGSGSSSGDRLSPKITVGITPVRWFTVYGTYAEGYRAPAVTETFIAGPHPLPAGFPGAFATPCPTGGAGLFCFLPNPSLRPEIGKTEEVGVNIRGDDLFIAGDRLRIKANAFRNNLTDFIEPHLINIVGPPPGPVGDRTFYQYQNTPNARIEGLELESTYDAGAWFAGLSGQRLRGKNLDTGAPLTTIPPDQLTTTLGVRFFERKVTASVRWSAVAGKPPDQVPFVDLNGDGKPDTVATWSYNLVNLYLSYQPNPDVLATFSVENALNEYYFRYLENLASVAFPAPGITFKMGVQVRLGGV